MGAVANGALSEKGKVIGVLPHFLAKKEIAHPDLSELILVDSMHERKAKMNELCDGVIALPGGFGTLDELFEMLTWAQLGIHQKPIGVLNVNNFYKALLELIDNMVIQGTLKPVNRALMIDDPDSKNLLNKMIAFKPKHVSKWI
jgi:hypothetical protein